MNQTLSYHKGHPNPQLFRKNYQILDGEWDFMFDEENIGIYKNFVDQEFMKQVEQRLGEYCYYPEKENLSEEAWNLLKMLRHVFR